MTTFVIVRPRGYNHDLLLRLELTLTSFYLFKEKNLRKSEKSKLVRELKHTLKATPSDDISAAIIFDFMVYCCKLLVKKLKLKTCEDLPKY